MVFLIRFLDYSAPTVGQNKAPFHFPRPAACELAMASVLAPLMATDISTPFAAEAYATDASSGICSARVGSFASKHA